MMESSSLLADPDRGHDGTEPPVPLSNSLPTRIVPGTERNVDEQDEEAAEIGDEEEALPVSKERKVSEKKRRQDTIFKSWFAKQASTITKESVTKAMEVEDEEILSIKALMARQESEPIITSPREYQMELFEKAKIANTIAVLDTGSGKTLIAVMLLRHTIDQELENRGIGKPPRISFFLVDKVALVFQQHAVLRANLDQNIERLCGAMGCDTWSREAWLKTFMNNMIIVCTADVLLQCLAHSFIKIEQINLLVFDEAHHAKKGHAYARIIKDFYLGQDDPGKRPRIFGMTASPVDVDAKDDLREKANELEVLLHSRIVTTSNWNLLAQTVYRPDPLFVAYSPLGQPFETRLYKQLWAKYWDLQGFRRLFDHAEDISSHLGRWCSDVYWSFAFSERQARNMEIRAQRRDYRKKDGGSNELLDAEIAQLKEAHTDILHEVFGKPELNLDDLSTKVLKLHQTLQLIFSTPSEARCLVFVDRRFTARLLKALFDHIGGPHLKPGFLIGANSTSIDGIQYSIKQQVVTLLKFRRGDLNCLFATSVAEEGLDIQDCGYVIRFDPCKTMIQYIQSRGRARQRNSKFFHLIESNNMVEKDHLDSLRRSEDVMRNFCQSLPEDRRLQGNDICADPLVRRNGYQTYREPSTGATLTFDFSLVVLAHFVTCLPHEDEDDLSINYVMSVRAGKFLCEVVLPPQSPIRSALGKEANQKATAKRSAAFEACIALRKGRYLDANLLPIYAKQLPAMRNAVLALNAKSSNVYPMQSKPSLWSDGRGTLPESFFLTVMLLKQPWDRPVSPLGLITRFKLPDLPVFPIYRATGQLVDLVILSMVQGFVIDTEHIAQLTGFTLGAFKDIFNKTFEFKEAQMSYWLAPLRKLPDDVDMNFSHPEKLIDWDTASRVHASPARQWSSDMSRESLVDRFIVDPWDGGRRLFTTGIDDSLHPSDPVPPGVAPGYNMQSIIQYSVKLWRKARGKREWIEEQPVFTAEKALHRLNLLAEPSEVEKNTVSHCFVCLEPMNISELPTGIAGMALVFPAVIHRMESYLIALEFTDQIGLQVKPELALEAITKDSDNTEDAQGERINFQHGMGPNYERLEFIGDCFLKMATSISLLARNIGNDEEQMHIKRMLMICNKNLFNNATKNEYFKYVRGLTFSRRTWYPEGLKLLAGKGAKDEEQKYSITQPLGDKTIADICEAMIGAAFVSHFQSGYGPAGQMDQAVKAVSVFVASGDHDMKEWADYYRAYTMPAYQTEPSNAAQRDLATKIEAKLGYIFRYPRLLRLAFQHPCIGRISENLPSYQRLEFLGDSLLDMAAVTYLFEKYPTRDPQWLTEHKMAMVSNKFLGAVAVKLGFNRHLRQKELGSQILAFVTEIEEAEEHSNGARDYWTTVKDPPKCLPDIVESYVGALFVDSEFNYAEVQRFFDNHIKWFFEDMKIYDTFANNHPVTKIHHLLSETMSCHSYAIHANDIPSIDGGATSGGCAAAVMVHDTVVAHGHASSSKYAKIRASTAALEELMFLAPWEFRVRVGGECVAKGKGRGVVGKVEGGVGKVDDVVGAVEEGMRELKVGDVVGAVEDVVVGTAI